MTTSRRWLGVLAIIAGGLFLNGSAAQAQIDLDKSEGQNDLRQIGIFYKAYQTEHRRYPKNLGEFLAYIKKEAPGIHRNLEKGNYVLVVTNKPTSERVLGYQKDQYKGMHSVVMGDGSVSTMTNKELQKNLQDSK